MLGTARDLLGALVLNGARRDIDLGYWRCKDVQDAGRRRYLMQSAGYAASIMWSYTCSTSGFEPCDGLQDAELPLRHRWALGSVASQLQ